LRVEIENRKATNKFNPRGVIFLTPRFCFAARFRGKIGEMANWRSMLRRYKGTTTRC
jgi:hypothetical protein